MFEIGLAAEPEVAHRGLDLFLPTWSDILWSAVVLLIIAVAFYKFIMPKFMAILDKRSELIAGGLQQAEQVKAAAEETLNQRQAMLQEARIEASDIRNKAQAEGNEIVQQAKQKAEDEVQRVERVSMQRIAAQRQDAEADLQSQMGTLATELAAKILADNLNTHESKAATVDRFLDKLEAEENAGSIK
jgi:F-type H+-transporting ATPase subunit b